jgi:hypothetical protein
MPYIRRYCKPAKLVRNFGAIWCPQRDERGRIVSGSQPKLYLSDPILGWLPSRLHPGCRRMCLPVREGYTLGAPDANYSALR